METEICSLAPPSWNVRSLEDVCSRITSGGTPSRTHAAYFVGSIPWVKTQELQDGSIWDTEEHISGEAIEGSAAKLLPVNTLLLAMYGATVGQLGILRVPAACNQACSALIVDPKVADYRYVFYQLRQARSFIKNRAVGAAQQNISGQMVKSLRFPFPTLAEQQLIGETLARFDLRIEVAAKANRLLDSIARALYHSWFVAFDPVRAKMEGRPTGLPDDVAALFPDRLVDSPVGQVPDGWTASSVGAVSHVNERSIGKGFAHSVIDYVEISNVEQGFVRERTRYDLADAPSRAKRLVRHGDTVISTVRPDRRNFFLAWHPNDNLVVSTGFVTLTPRGVPWAWLYLAATQADHFDQLGRLADGGAYPAVRPDVVAGLPVVVPPAKLAAAFAQVVEPLLARFHANVDQGATLAGLRDALLPRLLSGELRVRAERSEVAA